MTGTLEGAHALPAHVAVAIVGSGFAGLATAIALKRAGREDFVMLERADDLGGTWRDNSYPGCACDVPSHLYSYSFAPNPQWSRTFSPQPEIEAYLHRTALEAGVLPTCASGRSSSTPPGTAGAGTWSPHAARSPPTCSSRPPAAYPSRPCPPYQG